METNHRFFYDRLISFIIPKTVHSFGTAAPTVKGTSERYLFIRLFQKKKSERGSSLFDEVKGRKKIFFLHKTSPKMDLTPKTNFF
jgi:hypothetical protein